MQTLVLDTNVLLDNPSFALSVTEGTVVIPFEVILELERLKTKYEIVGKSARQALALIDSFRSLGSLHEGVKLETGVSLKVYFLEPKPEESPDDIILRTAQTVGGVLVTGDIALRVKADVFGVPTTSLADVVGELEVRDRTLLELSQEEKDSLFKNGSLPIRANCYPNEFLVANQALGRFDKGCFRLLRQDVEAYGIKPKSKEQIYAMNVLLDPKIPLVTLTGPAGCGKTLLALASALALTNEGVYEKSMITRPIIPMGNDIGFLPGSLTEKMDPWIQPLKDNLMVLTKGNAQSMLHLMDRWIEIEALTFIRGRSLPRRFFIIDEAQNLSPSEVKTIVTRMGEGSKVVFTGDLQQVDTNRSERSSNGLSYLITKMLNEPLAAHIHLQKSERSTLAARAAEIL